MEQQQPSHPAASSPSTATLPRMSMLFKRGGWNWSRKIGGSRVTAAAAWERTGEAGEWLTTRPLRMWRTVHSLSCFAAAISRVNVPSAIYLFFFVAQASLAPGGGMYKGTSRAEMSRIEVLHAWFAQR